MANYTVLGLKAEYLSEWNSLIITRPNDILSAAHLVIRGKDRYLSLQNQTGVPWYFIGILHLRESNCNFNTHLYNGDSLQRRTYHDPAGKPLKGNPPFGFEFSAICALTDEGFLKIKNWPIEQIAYSFEQYNGWGYRYHKTPSAYLWSGSNVYHRGKFVKDGVFDSSVVDIQVGCMPTLKKILELEKITLNTPTSAPIDTPMSPSASVPTPTNEQMNQVSNKHWWTDWAQWITGITAGGTATAKTIDVTQIDAAKSTLDSIKSFFVDYGVWVALFVLAVLFIFFMYQKSLIKEDIVEGRSAPSGGEPGAPEETVETAVNAIVTSV